MVYTVSSKKRWIILGVSTFSLFILMMNFSVYPVVLLDVAKELSLTNTQIGFLMFIYSIFYAIAQIPAGALVDKFGGSKIASLSITILGAVGILFSLSINYTMAVLTRIIMGFSCGFFLPATIKLLPSWFKSKEYDQAMGIFGTGQGLALFITFISVPLVSSMFNWRMGLLYVSGLTLICAVLSWVFIREGESTKYRPLDHKSFRLNKILTKQLIILTSFNFTGLAVYSGVITWAPKFLTNIVKLPLIQIGYITAVIGVMNIFGAYFGGLLSKKGRSALVIIISMVCCVISPILLYYAQTPISALLVIALVGWGTMFYFAPTFAGVPASVEPQFSGLAFGIFNSLSFIGGSITPLLAGIILDVTNRFDLALLSIAIVALFGLVYSFKFKPHAPVG